LKEIHPPPMDKRSKRRLNLLYGTQYQTTPPRFRIWVNDRKLVTRSYGYFIENRIREKFEMDGVPVVIDYRSRE
jgi:GTP-binding protein